MQLYNTGEINKAYIVCNCKTGEINKAYIVCNCKIRRD